LCWIDFWINYKESTSARSTGKKFLIVKYEDILKDKETVIAKILGWLEYKYSSKQLQCMDYNPIAEKKVYHSKWTKLFESTKYIVKDQLKNISKLLNPYLCYFGYTKDRWNVMQGLPTKKNCLLSKLLFGEGMYTTNGTKLCESWKIRRRF